MRIAVHPLNELLAGTNFLSNSVLDPLEALSDINSDHPCLCQRYACFEGGTHVLSAQRGNGKGCGRTPVVVIGSPHIPEGYGPNGRHPEAQHESVQEDRSEPHLVKSRHKSGQRTQKTYHCPHTPPEL